MSQEYCPIIEVACLFQYLLRRNSAGLVRVFATLFSACPHVSVRTLLSELELQRSRIAELEKEVQSLMAEKKTRLEEGKPVDDLDNRLEELERRKHSLVERLQDRWSA